MMVWRHETLMGNDCCAVESDSLDERPLVLLRRYLLLMKSWGGLGRQFGPGNL